MQCGGAPVVREVIPQFLLVLDMDWHSPQGGGSRGTTEERGGEDGESRVPVVA